MASIPVNNLSEGNPSVLATRYGAYVLPDGYLINFDVYQGKSPNANSAYEHHFGKCAAPLLTLIDEFPNEKKRMPYHCFFDNLFTSLNLLNYFRQQGYGATGTVRENRLQKCKKLTSNKIMKKKQSGYHEYAISKEDRVIVAKWMDNSIVSIASNNLDVQPLSMVKRYSQKDKATTQVPRPFLLGEYNKYMVVTGWTKINMYRIHIRGKKWYWSLITWMLDTCTQCLATT
ncbi:PiggyBac transposable element-derived protein 2 [Eumeta japonica]|uniref:PiggyBac transposable element-derived protein 2 n=1 Tax=Eumeta variegata TaxID=151549 RepID=A0A4C1ZV82_EUMVA|nr:PiggyBac transposable element-derived protein 2 [Eumeta japonica]